jgi:hypothetical protein
MVSSLAWCLTPPTSRAARGRRRLIMHVTALRHKRKMRSIVRAMRSVSRTLSPNLSQMWGRMASCGRLPIGLVE